MKSEYGYIEVGDMKSIYIKLSEKIKNSGTVDNIDIPKSIIRNLKQNICDATKKIIIDDLLCDKFLINHSYSLNRLEKTGKCLFSTEITLYPKKEVDKNTIKLMTNNLIKMIKDFN